MVMLAAAAAGMAVAGALMSEKSKKEDILNQARTQGIQEATQDYQLDVAKERIMTQVGEIRDAAAENSMMIEQRSAMAEADAITQAAVAGVEGGSVDLAKTVVQANEAKAQRELNSQRKAELDNVKRELQDSIMQTVIGKGSHELQTYNQGAGLFNVAAAGFSSFSSAYSV